MKLLIVVPLFLLANVILAKEQVVYEAKGAELVDLIRGRPPQGGALKLTRVEGDRANLPDGIYYEPPEDEALVAPGNDESPYIYLRDKQSERPESDVPEDVPSSTKNKP